MSEPQKTDRQTDKTTRWAFTAYQDQWPLFESMPELVSQWGWQKEICPDTQREHYQGFLLTKRQCRFNQLKALLPGVHIEAARNWAALVNYCKKTDSAIPKSQVFQESTYTHLTMSNALLKLAAHVPFRAPPTFEEYASPDWEKTHKAIIDREYIEGVKEILRHQLDLVGIYSTNAMRQTWHWFRDVFIEKSIENITLHCDRQTEDVDVPKNIPAFEN